MTNESFNIKTNWWQPNALRPGRGIYKDQE